MQNVRKVLQILFTIIIIISITVTIFVGTLIATNYQNFGRLIQVGVLIKSEFLWPVSNRVLVEGAIDGMVDSLGDRYSAYLDREKFRELQEHIQGTFGGLGIYVGMRDERITVISPIEGTPGERIGIRGGDVIISINDLPTVNMTLDEAVEQMRGEPGTEVKVAIERPGRDTPIEYTVVREIIDVPAVKGELLEEHQDIAYMRIAMFASNTDEAFTKEFQALREKGFKGLIIDLRNNPGGDLNSVVNIARHLMSEGPVVHIVNNRGQKNTLMARGAEAIDVPLVVLINEGSASASEILAGAVRDTGIGTLIGKNTFGKGVVQNVYFLSEGAGLKLTTSKYLTPNELDIHGTGIAPDIEINLPEYLPNQEEPLQDTQFERAVEYILEKMGN